MQSKRSFIFHLWRLRINGHSRFITGVWLWINLSQFLKTESRYKNKLTAEPCFHLHKILDSVLEGVRGRITFFMLFSSIISQRYFEFPYDKMFFIKQIKITFVMKNLYNLLVPGDEHIYWMHRSGQVTFLSLCSHTGGKYLFANPHYCWTGNSWGWHSI